MLQLLIKLGVINCIFQLKLKYLNNYELQQV